VVYSIGGVLSPKALEIDPQPMAAGNTCNSDIRKILKMDSGRLLIEIPTTDAARYNHSLSPSTKPSPQFSYLF
jgi:hypothetical protein